MTKDEAEFYRETVVLLKKISKALDIQNELKMHELGISMIQLPRGLKCGTIPKKEMENE